MRFLDTFITSKLAIGCSAKTVGWYQWMLGNYAVFCHAEGLDEHDPETCERFFVRLRQDGAAAATVSSYYRAMHVYFGWLVRRGLEKTNPLEVVTKPMIPRRRPGHVTRTEFDQLFDSIEGDDWIDYRDRCILLVMFYSGLRVGEVVALKRQDVDIAKSLIAVRKGKGGHERYVPFAPPLAAELERYLGERPEPKKRDLWLSNNGVGGIRGILTAEGIRSMLRRRCRAAGLRYLNPHRFRHGYAMTLLNAGMNLSAVSAALGHTSSVVTEQVYAAWLTEGLSREYAEALHRLAV